MAIIDPVLREHVAHEIWSRTFDEDDGCERCGCYEPCAPCLEHVYRPAADAVLALVADVVNGSDRS